MRDYELMWILPGSVSDEDGEKSIDTVKSLVSDNGGDVKSAGLWARRTLSYPIKKNSEGAYYLARFSIEPAATPGIAKAMEANQDVLRHILVKEERKKAVEAES